MKCPDLHRKRIFATPLVIGMGGPFTKYCFTRNYMKSPDLHRNLMFTTLSPQRHTNPTLMRRAAAKHEVFLQFWTFHTIPSKRFH